MLLVLAVALILPVLSGSGPLARLPDRVAGWLRGPGADLVGAVTHVRDGDTVEVAGTPVRIGNLDCAERGTRAGDRATARMRELAAGQEVACRLEGRRSYDREVGTCALASSGEDLGEALIAEGTCGRWGQDGA